MLGYEVVAANLPDNLFFSLKLIGIAPTATLAGVLGSILAIRGQYALVAAPAIVGFNNGWSPKPPFLWIVNVHNVGAGLARIADVSYRCAVADDIPRRLSPSQAVDYLSRRVPEGKDFWVREVTAGHFLRPATDNDKATALFALDVPCAEALSCFEVTLRYVDSLGDCYVWERDFADLMRRKIPPLSS